MKRTFILIAALFAAAATFAQGKFDWVDSRSVDPDKMLPGVNPAKVTGNVITAGSSTVAPLSAAIIEQFKGRLRPDYP